MPSVTFRVIAISIANIHRHRYDLGMLKQDVLDHFGGATATAQALGVSQPSVSNWEDPIPELRQLQIEKLTCGVLRAGPECEPYRVPPLAEQPA